MPAHARKPKNETAPSGESQTPLTGMPLSTASRLLHERMRLAIMSSLAVNPSLTFSEMRHLLNATDGNLSVHARKLEDAGYISCAKSFEGRTPKTEYALTETGREALGKYLDHMEALIKAVRKPARGKAG